MTSGNDYSQKLQACVTAWQQLVDAVAALAGTVPTAGPVPGIPSIPQVPPDYPQQVTGYLQAWRQYLEQATGAAGPTHSPPAPPQHGTATGHREPNAGESGSRTTAPGAPPPSEPADSPPSMGATMKPPGEDSSSVEPPKFMRAPQWQWGGQITDLPGLQRAAGQDAMRDKGFDMPRPPLLEFGVAPNVRRTATRNAAVRRVPMTGPTGSVSADPAASLSSTLYRGLHERIQGQMNG
ncbi:hypothetical protein FK535_09670 [Mycolicibacterium sp. 018/SC-01/001]|uniref:hypothetical protein n=1 Tax=Mycolicibacterium sp. 018/SC-01/001 TaxID=2592069 RepID=UPI00117E8BFC|nr:hypothetical protein [Mycolicibacterium sp. 018/SC-01/001]TRW84751.1 hypothetical protein FK535_09670 [Mycolicibacterium sp. 018/SC-01/001]